MITNMTNKSIRHIASYWLFFLLPTVVFCQQIREPSTAEFSWGKEVIEHYRLSEDQEKFKAACLLITSMPGHQAPEGKAFKEYIQKVSLCKIPCSQDTLSSYWKEVVKLYGDRTTYSEDTLLLDKEFLISHIEQSFQAWRNAPWHKDVCFDEFCQYILPYRVSNEKTNCIGRPALTAKYASLIQGETDIVKAFTTICSTMFKRIRQTEPLCPYIPDAHTIDYLQQGNCLQRCVLLTEVLRSLGIPCTIDIVPVWANYSQVGHSWVAMPYKGMNYTWREDDTIARAENPIDASYFKVTYHPTVEDNYPYPVERQKKTAKIYRLRYRENNQFTSSNTPKLFTLRLDDVSSTYGLTDSVTLSIPMLQDNASYYLCTFRSGQGWTPIAQTLQKNGKLTFNNIGTGIVYIVSTFKQGILSPSSSPFILEENGTFRFFIPEKEKMNKQRIYRKYPVFSQWTNQWGNMIGGTFEGSDELDFSKTDTLATINSMPFGETIIPIHSSKIYRYVRYQSTHKSRTPLAELTFFNTDNRILSGIPISHKSLQKSKERVFDSDISTEGYTKQTNYWVGLDLGDTANKPITSVRFFPKNDGNFVTRGNFYELFYYENGWKSLGERFSVDNYVEYNIPEGALLWLKCDTGHEERIFEYKNGRQVWY